MLSLPAWGVWIEITIGLALETMIIFPIVLGYLLYLMVDSKIQFFNSGSVSFLLMGEWYHHSFTTTFIYKECKKSIFIFTWYSPIYFANPFTSDRCLPFSRRVDKSIFHCISLHLVSSYHLYFFFSIK